MATFFTSDEHIGHENVIRLCGRPFTSLFHMHETLIERHNARVAPSDTVYHLGDFAWKPQLVETLMPRLHGRHFLVPGNHDKCHPMRTHAARWRRKYAEWGIEVLDEDVNIEIVVSGTPAQVRLCHFPYAAGGDSQHEARYPEWRPAPDGHVLLCGHVHDAWRVGRGMFNVGVDVNGFAPVTADEAFEALKTNASTK
jgi:calcineurin-like phosphoesterase family protein